MKMKKYDVLNTIFAVLFLLVLDFGLYFFLMFGTVYPGISAQLRPTSEEKLVEQYKDDERFTEVYKNIGELIEGYKEELNEYEVGSEEYERTQNNINYFEKYQVYHALYATLYQECAKYIAKIIAVIDVIIVGIYAVFMYVSSKKTKEEKVSTKKTTRKTSKKK